MTSTQLLQGYLDSIHNHYFAEQPLFIDTDGSVKGRFFKCEIATRFEPIYQLADRQLIAVAAKLEVKLFNGTSIPAATMFTLAKSEESLVRLDRLSRVIHTLNHQTSPYAHLPLHLAIHPRLPTIVSSDHGQVFEHLLGYLGLSTGQLVIELPLSVAAHPVLAAKVSANYHARGFQVSSHVDERSLVWLGSGIHLPDLLKVNAALIHGRPDVMAETARLAERFGLKLFVRGWKNTQVDTILHDHGMFAVQKTN